MSTKELLTGELRVINIGLEGFAETLEARGVPVVQIDWRPPADGDREILDLLTRLGG